MRTLGTSGGWMFFEHAGTAVAVSLDTDDVTDVFDVAELNGAHTGWNGITGSAAEQRAAMLARSALAGGVYPLRAFRVPETVRVSARQALRWQQTYGRAIAFPVVASTVSLVPPRPVQESARRALGCDLDAQARTRAEELSSGRAVSAHLVGLMRTYFSRHQQGGVSEDDWLSWGGDAGRVWANRTVEAAHQEAQSVIEKLADDETVDYDTLRLLPRAFSIVASPHTAECTGVGECVCGGSKDAASLYPSERALTFLGLGGEFGRKWATDLVRMFETQALTATGYDPDAAVVSEEEVPDSESFDGTVPHVFTPVTENPDFCLYCGKDEQDPLHDESAVDYSNADTPPDAAHYFSEKLGDENTCEICGKPVDDTLHKQAALAAYYLYKDDVDKKVAETQQYWQAKGAPENAAGVTAAVAEFGEWVELPPESTVVAVDSDLLDNSAGPFDQAEQVDDELTALHWQRRGDEDTDPLTYYVSYVGDDQLIADQLYVTDGALFYQFDPDQRAWVSSSLGSPEQVYEVDDNTAREVIRAMGTYPGRPVDLREVDPGEALLMEECLPSLDQQMHERTAIVSATGATFDYTPEERAKNASRQVRDAGGRFAKSGSRVVDSAGKSGTVGKIDPASQKIEVHYDDGSPAQWVDAKGVNVVPQGKAQPDSQQPTPVINLRKIPAVPRATGRTPKGMLSALLPPMDKEALGAVVDNYSNFIEKERTGETARREAQRALNKQSRDRWLAEQKRAEEDYRRRLEKIHAQGRSARDWVDRIYNKILPGYRRNPTNPLTAASRKKKDVAPVPVVAQAITDPAQSDVAPVYLAEVDEANQSAVLELLAMVPASTTGTDAQVLRYTAAGWVPDEKMLRSLRSSAPPSIVALDEAQYTDTLEQVKHFYTTPEGKAAAEAEAKAAQSVAAAATIYGEYGELLAAGIPGVADTPSDIAATEKLKKYWTVGAGGAKIRWNTPGDWTRCNRHLKKYMHLPGQSEGYCANLHHLMTGVWPGDKRNVGRRGAAGSRVFQTKLLSTQEVIDFSALVAGANAQLAGVEAPQDVNDVPTTLTGAPFRIPIVAPVGVKSGDGRKFSPLALTTRELPLPLLWQIQTQEGHDASVIVGRIDSIDRAENGSLVNARGVFDVGPYGQEAERLVRHKFLRGVSVDLDNFEAVARAQDITAEREKDEQGKDEAIHIAADEMTVTNGRVMGVTLVAKPAFQECTIELDKEPEEETMVADGTYIGTPDTEAETEEMIRSALTAAGIPLNPPRGWFDDPGLSTETPLTVTEDGRVFGHIAAWNTEHIGLPFSTRPPKSRTNYAYFHTGLLRTQEGVDVPVGQITLAGGHAPLEANAAMAVKHYDDTASAMCDVHVGEDGYGIWAAGALRPNVTGEQVRAIRAASPSGDWRPINGRLELVAICQVNVPGFPVTRARVASGAVYALVAAGTATLNRLRANAADSTVDGLLSRVEALEEPQRVALEAAREAAVARVSSVRDERVASLRVRYQAAMNADAEEALFKDYSRDTREQYAKEGKAMKGGRYPIANVADLKRAIHAYGRGDPGDKPAIRRHIKKRARSLGHPELIPESWASNIAISEEFSFAAVEYDEATMFRQLSEDTRAEYTKKGWALGGGAYPIANVGDLKNALRAYPRGKYSKTELRRHIKKRARQLGHPEMIPDTWSVVSSVAEEFHEFAVNDTLVDSIFFRDLSSDKREEYAKKGWAMPGGGYPIANVGDLKNAIRAYGRAAEGQKAAVRRHIRKRARALGKSDLIPESWASLTTPVMEIAGEIEDLAARMSLISAGGRYPDGSPWDPSNHPRDEKGRFRDVIAELKQDLEGEAGTARAVQGLDVVEQKANQGDIEAAQQAAKGVLDLVDQIAANTEDPGAVKTLRDGYTNLAEAVANLPLVFGDLNQKYRFTDLPDDLQNLIKDLYGRAETRLDPENMAEAGGKLQEFMTGIDVLSQPQISAELSRILRYLI